MGTERKENGCVKAPKKDALSASELSGSWRTVETYLKKMPAILMVIGGETPMQRPAVVVSLLTVGMRELRGGKFGGL